MLQKFQNKKFPIRLGGGVQGICQYSEKNEFSTPSLSMCSYDTRNPTQYQIIIWYYFNKWNRLHAFTRFKATQYYPWKTNTFLQASMFILHWILQLKYQEMGCRRAFNFKKFEYWQEQMAEWNWWKQKKTPRVQ